jgi:hypothetical protein
MLNYLNYLNYLHYRDKVIALLTFPGIIGYLNQKFLLQINFNNQNT